MKAIIHLSNGNHIELDEYETQQLNLATENTIELSTGKQLLTFSNKDKTVKYTIDTRGIALIEYRN